MERKPIAVEATIAIFVLAVVFGVLYMMGSIKTPSTSSSQNSVSSANVTGQTVIRRSTITITGCAPEPKTKLVEKGSIVVFSNRDSVAHTIEFSPAFKFVVPARGQHAQIFNLWSKPGVRSYSCDGTSAVGKIDMYTSS